MRPRGVALLCLAVLSGCYVGSQGTFEMTCSTPYIHGSPGAEATARNPYSAHFTGGYACGLGGCFSLEAVSLPPGAFIDNYGVKTVGWTPPDALAGTTQTLTVRTPPDPCGQSAYFSWRVTVLPAPQIQRFDAVPAVVSAGGTVVLTPVFTDGDGRIDLWTGGTLGPVVSGASVTSPPLAVTTTFELHVLNRLGHGTSQTVTVQVN